MNKTVVTNLLALLVATVGFLLPRYGDVVMMTGLFALSGGLTNWLAIHMLFERVPFLYGSGVIPRRFEHFKQAIKVLIIKEFFNKEHIERFFSDQDLSPEKLDKHIDFDRIFEGLTDAIASSSLGSMLAMVGGKEALEPLKEPVTQKLKGMMSELATNYQQQSGDHFTDKLTQKVEQLIDKRLADLTPQMVKRIIQDMIHQHLGWLVVWGGIFGGLIGFVVSFIT